MIYVRIQLLSGVVTALMMPSNDCRFAIIHLQFAFSATKKMNVKRRLEIQLASLSTSSSGDGLQCAKVMFAFVVQGFFPWPSANDLKHFGGGRVRLFAPPTWYFGKVFRAQCCARVDQNLIMSPCR